MNLGLTLSFDDLNIEMVDFIGNDGQVDSSVINFDADNSITVVGVLDLHADDFLMYA